MRVIWRRFWRDPAGRYPLLFVLVLTAAVLLGPLVYSHTFFAQNANLALSTPSAEFWFGTDALGRDLFARVLAGGALSLGVGVGSAGLALLIGLVYGALAAFAGPRTEALLLRVAEALYSLPLLLVSALLLLLLGRGPLAVVLSLSLTSWVTEARLARALVRQVRATPYVESARSVGAGEGRLFVRHILPNILGPLLVSVTIAIGQNMLAESFLSFVGIGLEPPYASWGTLAAEGWRAFRTYPHLIIFPGLALFLTVGSFTLMGDALRDALDPTTNHPRN